jgi:hypothetical protein
MRAGWRARAHRLPGDGDIGLPCRSRVVGVRDACRAAARMTKTGRTHAP